MEMAASATWLPAKHVKPNLPMNASGSVAELPLQSSVDRRISTTGTNKICRRRRRTDEGRVPAKKGRARQPQADCPRASLTVEESAATVFTARRTYVGGIRA